eukprot:gnl/TRDRNA2_/TRDRNA2_166507_c2_seq2.p1 gnl/TRDRNA2_/TRDRNA2_166507_c2~~gnl/TRDRNA2_/TRDRNA2_166507_c2_seq2.p1  ORF type:complete len:136 (-),score=23.09 gnl/TRDRNA2_/TRDRNA2_166507_c2_seq2:20-427(-)
MADAEMQDLHYHQHLGSQVGFLPQCIRKWSVSSSSTTSSFSSHAVDFVGGRLSNVKPYHDERMSTLSAARATQLGSQGHGLHKQKGTANDFSDASKEASPREEDSSSQRIPVAQPLDPVLPSANLSSEQEAQAVE